MNSDTDTAILAIHRLCQAIAMDSDEDDVFDVLEELRLLIHADHWVYITFLPALEMNENIRILVGCPQAWLQEYERMHWYINDPVLRYARLNSQPKRACEIRFESAGQRRLYETARRFGLTDGFVVPAHAPMNTRVGMLYVAYEDRKRVPEDLFDVLKPVLRGLSSIILQWDLSCIRRDLIQTAKLTAQELTYLDYESRGYTAKEIAHFENANVNAIHRTFGQVINKMGVTNKSEAARIAMLNGLIPTN